MSLLKRLETAQERPTTIGPVKKASPTLADPEKVLKQAIHQAIISEVKPELLNDATREAELKASISDIADRVIGESGLLVTRQDRQRIAQQLGDEVLGFGPITSLLNDDDVSEVMVNSAQQVYVERKGRLELSDVVFRNNEHVIQVIEKIVAPLGRRIDESSPMVDARLPDGSRVNAIIPPLAIKVPTLTIRKFSREALTIENLVNFGTLSPAMAKFVQEIGRAHV